MCEYFSLSLFLACCCRLYFCLLFVASFSASHPDESIANFMGNLMKFLKVVLNFRTFGLLDSLPNWTYFRIQFYKLKQNNLTSFLKKYLQEIVVINQWSSNKNYKCKFSKGKLSSDAFRDVDEKIGVKQNIKNV